MADQHDNDFEIDRSTDRPARTDKRSVLHMFHDELGKALGIGRAKDVAVRGENGEKQGVMDAVNEAVKGAPAPGSMASEY
jgi:hypothetical protein